MLKRPIVVGIILLFLLSSMIPMASSIESQKSKIIYVDDDNTMGPWDGTEEYPYQFIQGAIDNASEGDTIFVYNGSYNENLTINKTIDIIGNNKYNTIIYGSIEISKTEYVFLKNFTVSNSDNFNIEIEMYLCNFTTIQNNIIKNMSLGIDIRYSNDNIITDNEIINTDISNIELFFSQRNHVINNTLINTGIIFQTSYNNEVINNTVNNKPLIYHEKNRDITIDYPTGQIVLIQCSNITVSNQHISDVSCAIQLIETKKATITNSKITNSLIGINVWLSENIIITKSSFNNTSLTILVFFSNYTIISQNQISNSFMGIMAYGTNIKIIGNYIDSCNSSILFSSMKNEFEFGGSNEIIHNHIENNDYGVIIQHTINENSRVSENNFIKNQIHIQFVILPENFFDFNNLIYHKADYDPYRFISNNFSIDKYKNDSESAQEFILFNRLYKGNYWDDWIGFGPKIIKGLRWIKNPLGTNSVPIPLPWVCLDWKPAKEPYDIPTPEVIVE